MAISKRNSLPALAVLTSANGTDRNGSNLSMENVIPGSLVFECTSAITTALVAATFRAQASVDGATWFNLSGVTASSAAGTGAPVTTNVSLILPEAAHAYPMVRVVATLAGAATAGADTTIARYRFVAPGGLDSVK